MKDTKKIKTAYFIRRYQIALNEGREKDAEFWINKLDDKSNKLNLNS